MDPRQQPHLLSDGYGGGMPSRGYGQDQGGSRPDPQIGGGAADMAAGYLRILYRWKWVALALGLLGGLAGFASYISTPEVYHARATLELQGFNENFMGMTAIDPQAGTGNYSPTALNLMTQLRIIESASLRQPVLERLQRELTPVINSQRTLHARLRARLGLDEADPLVTMRGALMSAAYSVSARMVPGTRIISIGCDSTNPEIAASFVNTMADEYIAQNMQFRTSNAQKTSQWLAGQIEESKFKLEQAETKLQEFRRKSGLIFVNDTGTLADSRLGLLQNELSAIQAERIGKQSRYEQAKASPPEALPEVLDDPLLREYQKRVADLRRERAQLLGTLTADHYRVKQVDLQIGSVESTIERERESLIRRVRNEYESSLNRERLLMGAHAAQASVVSSQASQSAQHGLLKREVETLRASLQMMLQQAGQASVVSAVQTTNVRMIDAAVPPGAPYAPVPWRTTGTGAAVGLFGGLAIGLLVDKIRDWRTGRKLNLPGHTSELLDVPELGVIPAAEASARRQTLLIPGADADDSPEAQLVPGCPNSPQLVESYRLVLASLALMTRNGRAPSTIVIASSVPGEGKTTVTSNLGRLMAETGRRVLLVDADLRRPRLHKRFGLPNLRGFSELVLGQGSLTPESLAGLVQQTLHPNLSLLAAGSATGLAVSQLFYSTETPALLAKLRQQFDIILIDTPPLLQFSEARLMGRMADGVILVVRAGSTIKQAVLASRQRLADDGIPVLGAILNDWDPKSAAPSSGYDQSEYYKGYATETES